jgi:hypothetical protein
MIPPHQQFPKCNPPRLPPPQKKEYGIHTPPSKKRSCPSVSNVSLIRLLNTDHIYETPKRFFTSHIPLYRVFHKSYKLSYGVRFQVLKAAIMKVTAFWDTEPRSLAEADLGFRSVSSGRWMPPPLAWLWIAPQPLARFLTLCPRLNIAPFPHWSGEDCWSNRFLYFQLIFRARLIHRSDDGGSTHLWNVGLLQRDYTTLYPRQLPYHTTLYKAFNI